MLREIANLFYTNDFRDKILKFFQNMSLLINYFVKQPTLKDRAHYVYLQLYLARRLVKLGKFIVMFDNIAEYRKHKHNHQNSNMINIYVANIFYILYHFTENIIVLSQVGFLKPQFIPFNKIKMVTQSFWAVGLVAQLVYELKLLYKSFEKEKLVKEKMLHGMTPQNFIEKLEKLSRERHQIGFIILRIVGDLICALQKSKIPEKIMKTKFNKGLIGFGGLISSLIYIRGYLKQYNVLF